MLSDFLKNSIDAVREFELLKEFNFFKIKKDIFNYYNKIKLLKSDGFEKTYQLVRDGIVIYIEISFF